MPKKMAGQPKLLTVRKRKEKVPLCGVVTTLGEFSPGGIPFPCWEIPIVKGNSSVVSSLLAHTKALLSSRKENEDLVVSWSP